MVYWYAQGILAALTFLFTMRISLFHVLEHGDTFKTQTFQVPASCPFATKTDRTYDGKCNRLDSLEMGGKGVRFGRVCPFNISIPETGDRLLTPNPKVVADKLLYRKDGNLIAETHVNVLAAAFLQFQTHDWFTHVNDEITDDPILVPNGQETMKVARTQKDPSFDASEGVSQTFVNTQTPWWDLEPIYGSKEFSASRRTGSGGKFAMTADNRIPINPESGIEYAGVDNNWWMGLSLMHNLYTREHNSIADMLAKAYPKWNDDQIFERARMINCAVNAKIHTLEWTPALLQDDILYLAMHANWNGLPGFKGVVGKAMDDFVANTTFQYPEEFVSVYRMHPMLPETLDFKPLLGSKNKKYQAGMLEVAFVNSTSWVDEYGLADISNSMGVQAQGKLTLLNYPTFLRDITTPTHKGQISPGQRLDLATIEIIRDRERGIPRYNAYRRSVNMESFTSMDQITSDPVHLALLNEVYGGDVEQVDLLVGQLAEETRPPGFGFSDTTFRLFIATASRRLMADRFFTDDYNEETYTKEGLDWIKAASMKKVMTRNIPELRFALAKVANPFIPWNNVVAQAQWLQIIAKSGADLAKLGVDVVFGALTGKKVMPH